MKKAATLLFAVLVFAGITSCEKTKNDVNKATEFDMSYTADFTIPGSAIDVPGGTPAGISDTLDIVTPDVSTGSSARFASEATSKDLIEEIKFTKFNISNSTGNLDFLKSFSIYLRTANMGDVLVATKTNIPKGSTSVESDMKDVNIKEYIFKEKIQFRVNVIVVSGTEFSGDQKLKTTETVHVKGKKI